MMDANDRIVGGLLGVILLAPLAAVLGCLLARRPRPAEYLNLTAAVSVLAAVLLLLPRALVRTLTFWHGYLIVDALGAWVLLSVASVYLLSSIYAIGYMRRLDEAGRLHRFYALFAGFALTTLCGPLMNNIGVYWIAIELTTLVSTFLVCFELRRDSVEAAWKYIVVVSAGISLALLGIILFYWAGSLRMGPTYDLTWAALRTVAPQLNPTVALAAFLLVLIGFGTKVGLAPMHTWLPDAHSEGPAPVSAMLSGALLNTAMIGIVRFLQVADRGRLGALPRLVVVSIGAFSLFIAALFIVRQRGIKRLMAYSSVEHMGIMTLGFGFGGPLGIAGALYHMLGHSLNKSLMFFGAGNTMQAFHTKRISRIHRVLRSLPASGLLWLAGAVAITGAPPFSLFLSELTIMRAGLAGVNAWAVFVMLPLLVVIFVGFLDHFRAMYFGGHTAAPAGAQTGGSAGAARAPVRESVWCVLPMWLALVPLLVLGLWWPQAISHYFSVVAAQLSGKAVP
ncbi:MAG TPA: proton-conducting transporter membrane subunit [Steroidobacteraceae bacterium]|nr:proton-conducting transporter membrane subunit [Steroidobacteraceae bacterium]